MSYKDILFHCDEIESILETNPNASIAKHIELIRRHTDKVEDEILRQGNEIDDLNETIEELEETIESDEFKADGRVHGTEIQYCCESRLEEEVMEAISDLFFNGLTHRQIINRLQQIG